MLLTEEIIKKVASLTQVVEPKEAKKLNEALTKEYLESAKERYKAINEMIKTIKDMQEYLVLTSPSDNRLLQSVRVSTRLETLLCVYERILDGYEWEEMPFEMYLGGKNEL